MFVAGSIASQFATVFGMMAAAIAVFGFVAHAGPALRDGEDQRIREATVVGGLGGLAVALGISVLSALIG